MQISWLHIQFALVIQAKVCQVEVRWLLLLSGAWICQESFIDSWITPHVVKPFIKTLHFCFAFFGLRIRQNQRTNFAMTNFCLLC